MDFYGIIELRQNNAHVFFRDHKSSNFALKGCYKQTDRHAGDFP